MRGLSLLFGFICGFGAPFVVTLVYGMGIVGHATYSRFGRDVTDVFSRPLFWLGVGLGAGLIFAIPWLSGEPTP